jgi:MoxR-like ATPase
MPYEDDEWIGGRIGIGEGKIVFASKPYKPCATEFIGRDVELDTIIAAWMTGSGELPLAPLLVGEPGIGKNRIVYEAAKKTGRNLYIFQGHEDVTAEDLACAVRFSDNPDHKMDYVVSPLVTAMMRGDICFIDEIAKIRTRALALLVSVLDERRYIDSTLLGERISAKEGFRFIAATNSADLEGNLMPEFLRSRLRPVINIGYPSREEIDEIVTTRLPHLQICIKQLVEKFWIFWNKKGRTQSPTPRDAIYVFSLASSLADYDEVRQSIPEDGEINFIIPKRTTNVNENHLKKAFEEIFRD